MAHCGQGMQHFKEMAMPVSASPHHKHDLYVASTLLVGCPPIAATKPMLALKEAKVTSYRGVKAMSGCSA